MKKLAKKLKLTLLCFTIATIPVCFSSCAVGVGLAEDLVEGVYMFSISWGIPFVESFYGEIEEDVQQTEGGKIIYEKVDAVGDFFEGIGDWFGDLFDKIF